MYSWLIIDLDLKNRARELAISILIVSDPVCRFPISKTNEFLSIWQVLDSPTCRRKNHTVTPYIERVVVGTLQPYFIPILLTTIWTFSKKYLYFRHSLCNWKGLLMASSLLKSNMSYSGLSQGGSICKDLKPGRTKNLNEQLW